MSFLTCGLDITSLSVQGIQSTRYAPRLGVMQATIGESETHGRMRDDTPKVTAQAR